MNLFALLTFYRSLVRHKLYAALNIGGLAVGIAVFLVLGLYVRFETGWEQWLLGAKDIYQIEGSFDDATTGGKAFGKNSPIALWTAVSTDLPNVVGTRVDDRAATVIKNGIGFSEDLSAVDPDFARVFDLPMAAGDLSLALKDPTAVAITQATARKYFGSSYPIGKVLTISTRGETRPYHVAAVIKDLPANTDLAFDILIKLIIPPNDGTSKVNDYYQWNYFDPQTYVRLPDRASLSSFTDELHEVISRHAADETKSTGGQPFSMAVRVQPLAKVHFEQAGKSVAVATLAIVGVLTLLIAIVNYVNLATARAGLRAREVAMRKVLGADRRMILVHYLGEAVGTTLIAALVGLSIAEVALPLVNAAAGLKLTLVYFGRDGVLFPLALLSVMVGLASGFYPAAVLSRFPAAAVLASARSPGGGRTGTRVREALVVAQFAIAIAFVIGTLVLTAQTRHVRDADVGYRRDGLMLVMSLQYAALTDEQRETILHRFATLQGVSSVTVGNNVPGPGTFRSETNIAVPGEPGQGPSIRFFQTTPGFFETVGAKLLAGRLFTRHDQPTSTPTTYRSRRTSPTTSSSTRRRCTRSTS